MRHDLAKAAILFRALTGRDVATVQDIIIEYAPSPKEEYLNDLTSFDTYIDYKNSQDERCGIGIEVKYTEQGYHIGKGELLKINDRNSTYYRVTKDSGGFDYGGKPEEEFIIDNFGDHERGNDLRQLWRNHILGLSMMQHPEGVKEFLSVHLYPSFNEHFNPETSSVLADYQSLLNEKGRRTFMPLTFESLFEEMMHCGMDEIETGWTENKKLEPLINRMNEFILWNKDRYEKEIVSLWRPYFAPTEFCNSFSIMQNEDFDNSDKLKSIFKLKNSVLDLKNCQVSVNYGKKANFIESIQKK